MGYLRRPHTSEQIEKAKDCKTSEEIRVLAKSEGVELTDDRRNAPPGGWGDGKADQPCSNCGQKPGWWDNHMMCNIGKNRGYAWC